MRGDVDQLDSDIESRQFMAHANSILELEQAKSAKASDAEVDTATAALPLIRRLDVYHQDKTMAEKKPNLAEFPPPFQVISLSMSCQNDFSLCDFSLIFLLFLLLAYSLQAFIFRRGQRTH